MFRVLRWLLVVAVVLALLAVWAARETSTPMSVDCGGTVSGGASGIVSGIDRAEAVGAKLRDIADHPGRYEDTAAIKRRVLLTVWTVWAWLRSARQAGHGAKLDPVIVKTRDDYRRQAQQLIASCSQQCPTVSPDRRSDPRASLQGLTGPRLAAAAARKAGFPESEIAMAATVPKYESSYRVDASRNFRGSHMRGLWQINDRYHSDPDWRDPLVNARMAYQVWQENGRSWDPPGGWTTAPTARRHLLTAASYDPPILSTLGPEASPSSSAGCDPADAAQSPQGDPGSVPPEYNLQGNPRTVEQATAWLMAAMPAGVRGERVNGRCERYMNLAYGLGGGYPSARAHWEAPGPRTEGKATPPRGALVFWRTHNDDWHVAFSLGGDRVISTDYDDRTGRYAFKRISAGPITDLDKWGPRLGYRPPNFHLPT